jgi:hypothetical protein
MFVVLIYLKFMNMWLKVVATVSSVSYPKESCICLVICRVTYHRGTKSKLRYYTFIDAGTGHADQNYSVKPWNIVSAIVRCLH